MNNVTTKICPALYSKFLVAKIHKNKAVRYYELLIQKQRKIHNSQTTLQKKNRGHDMITLPEVFEIIRK